MKWISSKVKQNCAKLPLSELLREQLDDEQVARVVQHLDHCEHCQQRLTDLSADAGWWRDAAVWLEPIALEEADDEHDDFGEFDQPFGPTVVESLAGSGLFEDSANPDMIGKIGRYDIRRVIGTGGTGVVLQAVDTELDRVVAIKVLSPTLASNSAARRRFSREGQAAASVAHENVVAIYHVEPMGPVPYLVMQYIDGCSLQELVKRSGPIDSVGALRIVAQLASGLEAAHAQGLVHRDVKPANIMVGAGQRVWITDFGLARAVDDASLTRTGFIAGTPHYMSPEQARGESVSIKSDLFGLGSVLYFALTGRPPFQADRSLAILNRICHERHRSAREVVPNISPAIESILNRLLEKKPEDRFQNAVDLRFECLRVLTQTTHVRTEGLDEKKPGRVKRLRRVKLLAATAIVLLMVSYTAQAWFNQTTRRYDGLRLNQHAFGSQPSNAVVDRQSGSRATGATQPGSRRIQQNFPAQHSSAPLDQAPIDYAPASAERNSSGMMNPPMALPPTIQASETKLWQDQFDQLVRDLDEVRDQWLAMDSETGTVVDWNASSFWEKAMLLTQQLDELQQPAGIFTESDFRNESSR